jgi:hypothetical protein
MKRLFISKRLPNEFVAKEIFTYS